jgi:hypothetical protein
MSIPVKAESLASYWTCPCAHAYQRAGGRVQWGLSREPSEQAVMCFVLQITMSRNAGSGS